MSKQQKIATWTPDPPVRMKVVHKGWLPADYGCPHCKKTMVGIIVQTTQWLDYWWLCDCGGGETIEKMYRESTGDHVHSVEYYQHCAWKIEQKVWPT